MMTIPMAMMPVVLKQWCPLQWWLLYGRLLVEGGGGRRAAFIGADRLGAEQGGAHHHNTNPGEFASIKSCAQHYQHL